MPEGADVTTELLYEHAELEGLVVRIASLQQGRERDRLVREAAARFRSHARAEERYLFPAFRRHLPDLAEQVLGQQRRLHAVDNIVESMAGTDARSEAYEPLVGQFVLDIQRHIEEQDNVLLPSLLDACPGEEVNNLGRQLRYGLRDERGEAGEQDEVGERDKGGRCDEFEGESTVPADGASSALVGAPGAQSIAVGRRRDGR